MNAKAAAWYGAAQWRSAPPPIGPAYAQSQHSLVSLQDQ